MFRYNVRNGEIDIGDILNSGVYCLQLDNCTNIGQEGELCAGSVPHMLLVAAAVRGHGDGLQLHAAVDTSWPAACWPLQNGTRCISPAPWLWLVLVSDTVVSANI